MTPIDDADHGGDCFSVSFTPSGESPPSSGTVDTGVTLVWDDLRISVPSRDKMQPPKLVLSGVSGSARSGQLLAVMGSSGAGKSCLLDALAGRSKGTHVSGSVRLHGASSSDPTKTIGSGVSYVPQEDILLNSATVEETFATAILLRLGPITQEELSARVDATIRDLKLEAVRTSLIGGADIRGISGGEKRRVSIGQEMCSNANAPVLLTDEPTSGLDSRTAEFVMRTLIELAQSKGTIVIATIHQPNSLITALFDDLLLLDRGRCVYFGPATGAVAWFENAGFPCPLNWNPTDHFLSVLDDAASADKLALALGGGGGGGGGGSDGNAMLQAGAIVSQQRPTTSLLHQAQVLALRNARQWLRDPAMFASELLQYIFLALFIGGMYYNLDTSLAAGVFNRTAGIFILLSVLIFTPPFTAITIFSLERHLSFKERRDRFYSSGAWVLAKSLVTFPIEAAFCLVFSAITYFMFGFQANGEKFFIFFGILLLFQLIGESVGLLFAISNKSPVYAIVWMSLVLIVALSLAGFLTAKMPPWYDWIAQSNVFRFALLALCINEFDGLLFRDGDSGPSVAGVHALPPSLQPELSMQAYIGILVAALVALRVTVVVVLHITDS